MLQAGRFTASNSSEIIGFIQFTIPSSHTMAVWLTQPLTEMSTRNIPGGKVQLARKADNLTAISVPIV
jgi:hypothetical protein